ncbi:MAG: sce7725 family protein [Microbacterium sp.]|nr:sce7725 family protein [Microbacterium sp.]
MYHPYTRGKQNELLALRETADVLAGAAFVPIIEPVRKELGGLERALKELTDAGVEVVVIVNPRHGELRTAGRAISALLARHYRNNDAISAGILLHSNISTAAAVALIDEHADHNPVIIHAGFTEARALAQALGDRALSFTHVFVEDQASTLYRRHFEGARRVLLRDGFEAMNNADYGTVDSFSDLHVTFPAFGVQGYGDFLTVGDRYTEGGGPAYAVAIHLTYIDSDNDEEMLIQHFVSDTNGTPSDTAGKFREALDKLIAEVDSGHSKILGTSAVDEFRRLHADGHYPGLGYVKKLSMRHHIETLAHYHAP